MISQPPRLIWEHGYVIIARFHPSQMFQAAAAFTVVCVLQLLLVGVAAHETARISMPVREVWVGISAPAFTPIFRGGGHFTVPEFGGINRAHCKMPKYPESLRAYHADGTVFLSVRISAKGRVTHATIEGSAGYPEFNTAALAAVRACLFDPPVEDGKPIAFRRRVAIEFNPDYTALHNPAGYGADIYAIEPHHSR
jgi:TonB family protein